LTCRMQNAECTLLQGTMCDCDHTITSYPYTWSLDCSTNPARYTDRLLMKPWTTGATSSIVNTIPCLAQGSEEKGRTISTAEGYRGPPVVRSQSTDVSPLAKAVCSARQGIGLAFHLPVAAHGAHTHVQHLPDALQLSEEEYGLPWPGPLAPRRGGPRQGLGDEISCPKLSLGVLSSTAQPALTRMQCAPYTNNGVRTVG
jgi:hypothetical protein